MNTVKRRQPWRRSALLTRSLSDTYLLRGLRRVDRVRDQQQADYQRAKAVFEHCIDLVNGALRLSACEHAAEKEHHREGVEDNLSEKHLKSPLVAPLQRRVREHYRAARDAPRCSVVISA